MAGHSQFANIKHRKEAQDKKRSKIFQRFSKEIMILAKKDNNPNTNSKLRFVIEQAKKNNMTKDAIQKALLSSSQNKDDYFEITYEAMGPENTCFVVETLTNNKNRTANNIRAAFSKYGGKIVIPNSLARIFKHVSIFTILKNNLSEENILEILNSNPIEELEEKDDKYLIYAKPEYFFSIKKVLDKLSIKIEQENIEWISNENIENLSEIAIKNIINLLDVLDADEDVQNIYQNFII